MKTCLIAPVPDLEKYIDETSTHHMILAHLFSNPALTHDYTEFYIDRASQGDYLILDNSARELGSGIEVKHLLRLAWLIGVKEIILPDTLGDAAMTLQMTQRALEFIASSEGRTMYEQANKPALMIVPQGASFKEFCMCIERLVNAANETLDTLDGPEVVIGIPYRYDHVFEDVHFARLIEQAYGGTPVHLLGCPRRLRTLVEVAQTFPDLRSIDSATPFIHARQGVLMDASVPRPSRSRDYFELPVPDEHKHVVRANIARFREFANDNARNSLAER